jgi:hypothetical protein
MANRDGVVSNQDVFHDQPVLGFQQRADAVRFLEEFKEGLAKFGLELHRSKSEEPFYL